MAGFELQEEESVEDAISKLTSSTFSRPKSMLICLSRCLSSYRPGAELDLPDLPMWWWCLEGVADSELECGTVVEEIVVSLRCKKGF